MSMAAARRSCDDALNAQNKDRLCRRRGRRRHQRPIREGIMPAHASTGNRELGYRRLIELGIALSAERNHHRLLETILIGAKELTNADGGTLYLVSEDRRELRFMIMRNDTMGIALGGTTGAPIPFPPVQLCKLDGTPNHSSVVAEAALTGSTINLADAYNAPGF